MTLKAAQVVDRLIEATPGEKNVAPQYTGGAIESTEDGRTHSTPVFFAWDRESLMATLRAALDSGSTKYGTASNDDVGTLMLDPRKSEVFYVDSLSELVNWLDSSGGAVVGVATDDGVGDLFVGDKYTPGKPKSGIIERARPKGAVDGDEILDRDEDFRVAVFNRVILLFAEPQERAEAIAEEYAQKYKLSPAELAAVCDAALGRLP